MNLHIHIHIHILGWLVYLHVCCPPPFILSVGISPHHTTYRTTSTTNEHQVTSKIPAVSFDENRTLVDSSRSSRWCMLGTLAGDGIEVARPPACGMLGYRPFPATLILQGHHSVAWAGGEGDDKSRPPRPWPSYRPCI